jgi:hypothetical protein
MDTFLTAKQVQKSGAYALMYSRNMELKIFNTFKISVIDIFLQKTKLTIKAWNTHLDGYELALRLEFIFLKDTSIGNWKNTKRNWRMLKES